MAESYAYSWSPPRVIQSPWFVENMSSKEKRDRENARIRKQHQIALDAYEIFFYNPDYEYEDD